MTAAHITHLPTVNRPRTPTFKPYRVYARVEGSDIVLRTFKTLAGALRAAARISITHSVAEVRDDAATMNRRLVAIFRSGLLLGTTRDQ